MTPSKPQKHFPSPTLTISVKTNHPKLLAGLETWVQLGLVSDQSVCQIGQNYLSCPMPSPAAVPTSTASRSSTTSAIPTTAKTSSFASPPTPSPQPPPQPLIPRLTQAVLDNFSITWLLFLGVFLVVLSSVVLAASNWQSVSPPGQYSILFGYTLAFWAAGTWTQRQPNLNITSWMLRVTTLLIIPINFWMIDGLGLWTSPLGWIIGLIAAIALSGMIFALVHAQSSISFLAAVNIIALSGLHWGWDAEPMPLLATYLGSLGTATLVNRYQTAYFREEDSSPSTNIAIQDSTKANLEKIPESPSANQARQPFPLGLIAIAFATFLLVIRAVTVGQVPWSQLGLAIGLCGWVLSWISRPPLPSSPNSQAQASSNTGLTDKEPKAYPSRDLWLKGGAKLLLLGWLVSVGVNPPWQAIIISGLGLWLLGDRLLRYWRSIDLLALFLVGLQALWLMQRLVPGLWRDALLELCIRLSGDQGMPTALLGLTLFPYVLVMLAVRQYLRHRQHTQLGQQATWMAMGLGSCLTLVSLLNPVTRSLNLLVSTITLGKASRPSPPSLGWVYVMHGLIVVTLLSWLDMLFPDLTSIQGAIILVGMTILEWALQVHLASPHIRTTAWTIGLVLGAIAYASFLQDSYSPWCVIWFLVPLMLIYVGHQVLKTRPEADGAPPPTPQPPQSLLPTALKPSPTLTGWLSTLTLLIGQPFLFDPSGLEGWGLAFNAFALLLCVPLTRSLVTAALSVGCGILSLWVTTDQIGLVTEQHQLYLWTATPGILWLLWSNLRSRSSITANLYGRVSNGWAITITTILLAGGTIYTSLLYTALVTSETGAGQAAIASLFLLLSLLYRLWKRTHLSLWGREWTYMGTAWTIGLFTAQLNASVSGTVITLAIAFLALGLITQLLIPAPTSPVPSRITPFIPLLYGVSGWSLSQIPFTAATGLYTLTLAVIAIGVGRRSPRLKALTILAIGLMTMASYQLLIYQMQQASGGQSGDGLMILAGLATGLAIFYGLGAWGRIKPWFHTYLQLPPNDLRPIAHCHWVLANGLGFLASLSPRSLLGHSLGMIIFTSLAVYALAWGHTRSPLNVAKTPKLSKTAIHGWTTLGIWQLVGAIAFCLYAFSANPEWIVKWGGAIASLVAFIFYKLPWQRWGWPLRPWFQTTLILPSVVILLTASVTTIPSVLIVAAFYMWFAKATNRIRISYLSIGFISWAMLWFLALNQWTQVLWVAVDIGGALLYIVEVDPALQPQQNAESAPQDEGGEEAIASNTLSRRTATKQTRHILRTLSTSLICFSSIYQSNITPWAILLTLSFSIALIGLGILLKTRAYLFVGTGTLLFEIIRYTRQFIGQHPLQIWAVGIVLGLAFIWIAATFESRRNQMRSVMTYWQTELASWE